MKWICAALFFLACADRPYKQDFEQGGDGDWYAIVAKTNYIWRMMPEIENGNRFIVSPGPWWVDLNHVAPGAGSLHVVAFAYHHSWSKSPKPNPDYPQYGRRHGVIDIDDLRNATVRMRLRARNLSLPKGANLLFWFQTEAHDPEAGTAKRVNYAKIAQPLQNEIQGQWATVSIKLTTADGDWLCLGSSNKRRETYGCGESVEDALSDFSINLGLIILIGNSNAIATGKIDIDDIEIVPSNEQHLTEW